MKAKLLIASSFSILAVTAALSVPRLTQAAPSPYAGSGSAEIKALSPQEVHGYLSGEGLGYAKPAEMNHYPGPRHVLDLADQLGLSPAQCEQAQQIFDRMRAAAVPLGKQIVDEERRLNDLFASRAIDQQALQSETAKIADLQGRFRAVHLSAHLATRAVLTPEQVAQYDKLRGYTNAGGSAMPGMHHHDGM